VTSPAREALANTSIGTMVQAGPPRERVELDVRNAEPTR
jgi:hypothetical protein